MIKTKAAKWIRTVKLQAEKKETFDNVEKKIKAMVRDSE